MQVSDFYYELPEELIAQEPPLERGASRMLVVSRKTQSFHDDQFRNLSRYVHPGDCLLLNNTRVFPARLHGQRNREGGATVEVFLLRPLDASESVWSTLVRPGKRARRGDRLLFGPELVGEIVAQGGFGERAIRFEAQRPLLDLFHELGETPLPPYIHRTPTAQDRDRYQTVFAAERGSVAAPTAGLHFTPAVLDECRRAGGDIAHITLHVGLGTFAPLREKRVEAIELHHEQYIINETACESMQRAERLVCVGTTSVRTLESALLRGPLAPRAGETNLFIYPGFAFRGTGALLTNFHLPASSLLMLVAAFGGRELMLAAYRHAVRERYRFFSYGDCMLIE